MDVWRKIIAPAVDGTDSLRCKNGKKGRSTSSGGQKYLLQFYFVYECSIDLRAGTYISDCAWETTFGALETQELPHARRKLQKNVCAPETTN